MAYRWHNQPLPTPVTADGRDLANEEWRVIPEFPNYEITKDGDVRNRTTGVLLRETCANGGWFYSLWNEGRKASRGTRKLTRSAWPVTTQPDSNPPGTPEPALQ